MPQEDFNQRPTEEFMQFRCTPAPTCGELLRRIGNELRQHKASLTQVITLETGKIVQDETFAPLLYVMSYKNFAEALAIHNNGSDLPLAQGIVFN